MKQKQKLKNVILCGQFKSKEKNILKRFTDNIPSITLNLLDKIKMMVN